MAQFMRHGRPPRSLNLAVFLVPIDPDRRPVAGPPARDRIQQIVRQVHLTDVDTKLCDEFVNLDTAV